MAWERYKGPEVIPKLRDYATVRSGGMIAFSKEARRLHVPHLYTYAVLYFDRPTRQIGIQLFTKDISRLANHDGLIRIYHRDSDGDVTINAAAFCKHFGLDPMSMDGKYPIYNDVMNNGPFLRMDLTCGQNKNKVHGGGAAAPNTASV